jgi:hypothetical protein
VHSIAGMGMMTLLWAQERHHELGDKVCVVDGATGSGRGRWQCIRASTVVRNDGAEVPGRSMTARAPGKFLVGNFGSLTA